LAKHKVANYAHGSNYAVVTPRHSAEQKQRSQKAMKTIYDGRTSDKAKGSAMREVGKIQQEIYKKK
jgi:hypothetical protein